MTTQEHGDPTEEQLALAVDTLKLLGDGTRLRILWALLDGEHSVNDLAAHVGAQPSAVSQHLAKLRLTRLVRTRREGNRVFYLAQDEHVRRLVEEALFHADHVAQALADHGRPRTGGASRPAAQPDRRARTPGVGRAGTRPG